MSLLELIENIMSITRTSWVLQFKLASFRPILPPISIFQTIVRQEKEDVTEKTMSFIFSFSVVASVLNNFGENFQKFLEKIVQDLIFAFMKAKL